MFVAGYEGRYIVVDTTDKNMTSSVTKDGISSLIKQQEIFLKFIGT